MLDEVTKVYVVYVSNSIYGLSYSWEGASALAHALPLGSAVIEAWEI